MKFSGTVYMALLIYVLKFRSLASTAYTFIKNISAYTVCKCIKMANIYLNISVEEKHFGSIPKVQITVLFRDIF
jgi:hypothetical protein